MAGPPKSLFMKGLDEFASRWLKDTRPKDMTVLRLEGLLQTLKVAEALLVSPRLSFRVYGENVVLAHLVNAFGMNAVQELLEEKAVEFILWRPLVTLCDDESLLSQGLHPLQSGDLDSKPHSDPLESAELGLRQWTEPRLSRKDWRLLARLASKRTILPPAGVSREAVEIVTNAYEKDQLASVGLKADKPINQVDAIQRKQLARLADETVEGAVLLKTDLDLYHGDDVWSTLMKLFSGLSSCDNVAEAAETVLNLERIPSIPSLITENIISLKDIVRIRNRKETQEFRDWLWSQPSPGDAEEVSKSYIAAMAPKVDIRERTWFKTSRIATIGVIGALLGAVAAGPIGGVAGAAIPTSVGIGVSLVDGLLFDRIRRGNNPRKFCTEVLSPLVAAAQVKPQR